MKYKYGTNYAIIVAFLLVMTLVPFSIGNLGVFVDAAFWAWLIGVPVMVLLWYESKYLIVDNAKIVQGVFWCLELRAVSMAEIVEISYVATPRTVSSFDGAFKPFALIEWFAGRYLGPSLKLIVNDQEALYLDLRRVKRGNEIHDLLEKALKSKWIQR